MKLTTTLPMCALALCLGGLFSQSAVAQDTKVVPQNQPLSASETWSADDNNKDGYLDRKEVTGFPGMLRAFKDIDTNGDDKISQDEYRIWRGEELTAVPAPTADEGMAMPGEKTWSDDDKNKDGYLDRQEVTGFPGMLRAFKDIDTDGDDKISHAEYNAWRGRDQAM